MNINNDLLNDLKLQAQVENNDLEQLANNYFKSKNNNSAIYNEVANIIEEIKYRLNKINKIINNEEIEEEYELKTKDLDYIEQNITLIKNYYYRLLEEIVNSNNSIENNYLQAKSTLENVDNLYSNIISLKDNEK